MLAVPGDFTLTFSWGFMDQGCHLWPKLCGIVWNVLKGALESDNIGAGDTSDGIVLSSQWGLLFRITENTCKKQISRLRICPHRPSPDTTVRSHELSGLGNTDVIQTLHFRF